MPRCIDRHYSNRATSDPPKELDFRCVGTAKTTDTGICRSTILRANRYKVLHLLRRIECETFTREQLLHELRGIAKLALCKRDHRHETNDVATYWLENFYSPSVLSSTEPILSRQGAASPSSDYLSASTRASLPVRSRSTGGLQRLALTHPSSSAAAPSPASGEPASRGSQASQRGNRHEPSSAVAQDRVTDSRLSSPHPAQRSSRRREVGENHAERVSESERPVPRMRHNEAAHRPTTSQATQQSDTDPTTQDTSAPNTPRPAPCTHHAQRRPLPATNATCLICHDDLTPSDTMVWCKSSCGQNYHKDCWDTWVADQRRLNPSITNLRCCYCRQPWDSRACPCDERAPEVEDGRPTPDLADALAETPPCTLHTRPRAPLAHDTECPICQDTLAASEDLVFCKTTCGRNIHKECWEGWRASQVDERPWRRPRCAVCRGVWDEEGCPCDERVVGVEGMVE